MKVTVYYKELRESEVVNNIFRLDAGQEVMLIHEDYKEKEYFAGISYASSWIVFYDF